MQITLQRASAREMPTVKHFFLDFFYDLSQYDDNILINEAGLPTWKPNGLPGPQTLEACIESNWWIRDLCYHYLIRVDGNPAGMIIICAEQQYLPAGVEYELQDFYITPKYRRQGVGRQAARAVFNLYHGTWVVYQLERNLPARAFWQSVIAEYTAGQYINLQGGIEQRFNNRERW